MYGSSVFVAYLSLLLSAANIYPSYSINDRVSSEIAMFLPVGKNGQKVLAQYAAANPQAVAYILETRRWYLKTPRPEALPQSVYLDLQEAFYLDFSELFKAYGWKYLLDWKVLAAKAARETFWGTSYLCNRAFNYFGIHRKNKSWVCKSFDFCATITRKDPDPEDFVVFPDFQSSLWMFIHTIYSDHFLARLPDKGARVKKTIAAERKHGKYYWHLGLTDQLKGKTYSADELIYTWSEHPGNNLCVNCTRASDKAWMNRMEQAARRINF